MTNEAEDNTHATAGSADALCFGNTGISSIKSKSCSRQNFAVNFTRATFSIEDRKISNVNGRLNRAKLNPEKIACIRNATLLMWPLTPGEKESGAWNSCCKSIDESCRRLNRPKDSK